jgi:disulfide bond formation protein DsbB
MNNRILLTSLLTALVMFLAACATEQPPVVPTDAPTAVPAGDAATGQQLYASTCTACHGADARGVTGLGKDLTTSDFVHSLSDVELVDFLLSGRSSTDPANTTGVDMPPKGGNPALTEQNLQDIVAFLRSIGE